MTTTNKTLLASVLMSLPLMAGAQSSSSFSSSSAGSSLSASSASSTSSLSSMSSSSSLSSRMSSSKSSKAQGCDALTGKARAACVQHSTKRSSASSAPTSAPSSRSRMSSSSRRSSSAGSCTVFTGFEREICQEVLSNAQGGSTESALQSWWNDFRKRFQQMIHGRPGMSVAPAARTGGQGFIRRSARSIREQWQMNQQNRANRRSATGSTLSGTGSAAFQFDLNEWLGQSASGTIIRTGTGAVGSFQQTGTTPSEQQTEIWAICSDREGRGRNRCMQDERSRLQSQQTEEGDQP